MISSLYRIQRFFFMILFVGMTSLTAIAQPASTPFVNTEYTRPNGQQVLLGHCMPFLMKNGAYQEWYERYYDNYAVDADTARQLAPLFEGKVVEIFAGTWCGDTRREIPRLMKILETAQVDTTQLKLIFVDNSKELYKQSPQHEEAGKFIHHIPTIIIYDGERELNRIVEKPVGSLEEDLIKILSEQPYTPHFHAITVWQQSERIDQELKSEQLQAIADRIEGLPSSARELSSYAVTLSSLGKDQEAVNVLKLNALLYPEDETTRNYLDKLTQTAAH